MVDQGRKPLREDDGGEEHLTDLPIDDADVSVEAAPISPGEAPKNHRSNHLNDEAAAANGDGPRGWQSPSNIQGDEPAGYDRRPEDLANIDEQGLKSLEIPAMLFTLALMLIWILFFVWHPEVGVVVALFALPMGLLGRWWWLNRVKITLNTVVLFFAHGFVTVFLSACVLQWIAIILLFGIFGGLVHSMAAFMIFCFFLVFGCYCNIEEYLKVVFVRRAHAAPDPNAQTKTSLLTSTAVSLGYATAQGLLWLVFFTNALEHLNKVTFGWLFFYALVISVWGTPIHVMTGYLTGLELALGTPPPRIVLTNTAVRGLYIYQLILIIALGGIGIILLLLTVVAIYIFLWFHIKKTEAQLPNDYIERMGQLGMIGYGVLGDGDDLDGAGLNDGAVEAMSPQAETGAVR